MIRVRMGQRGRSGFVAGPGCWEWQGTKDRVSGYGWMYDVSLTPPRVTGAHRYMWSAANGPIPKGLEIHHICRNRACVNPAHLEAITKRENLAERRFRRRSKRLKTHCTKCGAGRDRPDHSYCKPCRNQYARERRQRVKQTGAANTVPPVG